MSRIIYSGFVLIFILMTQVTKTQEPLPAYVKMLECQPAYEHYYKELPPYFLADKFRLDKINEISFTIVDSLANGYSFFSNEQQPISYFSSGNTLVMIKRGAMTDAGVLNSLNNIFYRTSNDWGKSWSAPVLLYDYRSFNPKNRMGRYPSIYAFEYEQKPVYVYTFSVTDGTTSDNWKDGWKGVINGIYIDNDNINSYTPIFKKDNNSYNWSSGSKILGRGFGNDELYGLAIGSIYPIADGLTDNSNIGYRRTEEFDDWGCVIPDAWSSSRFFTVDTSTSRRSGMIGLKYIKDNEMLMAAFGGFEATKDIDSANTFGVSKSVDDGKTWTEFNICPNSLIKSFAEKEGFTTGKFYIPWDAKDFVVFENGDFSIGSSLVDLDTTVALENRKTQFIEIYNESGIWGVRRISFHGGYTLLYLDENNAADQNGNQLGYEFQMIRSVDGNHVIAKWVDFVDVFDEVGDSVIKNATTDIMVCARENNISKKSWGKTLNITEDIPFDRITWLPDLIPNNLLQIPIMRLRTMPIAGQTAADARRDERKAVLPQYITYGHFDATLSVGVEDKTEIVSSISATPNPAATDFSLSFTLPEPGNIKIKLYNSNGFCVKNIYEGFTSDGMRGMNISTDGLSSGAYYCTLEFMGSIQKCNLIIWK